MNAIKLLFDDSPETIDFAAKKCIQYPELVEEMLDIAVSNRPVYSILAARVINKLMLDSTKQLSGFCNSIIKRYSEISDHQVKIVLMELFYLSNFEPDVSNFILLSQHCFRELDGNGNENLKILCLEVLNKLAIEDDDLRSELFWLLHKISFLNSGNLKSRSEEIIKKLFETNRGTTFAKL
ncbi:MAG: hypothetical protein JXR58_12495 [Bacteroidales bacterium]|nr:hypothetical protein [Bacteroidales bacterium]